ncbi:bifunctional DNA primase/polymerase [Magnetospirillum sp. UT-4]|uniref:bifunctional DNA primase/polymerase n=1 Tax=Magnetospirillum sp. UT-4 TaxID=2681467 RepID=UPI00138073F2|nr:bifunctional DNA primase/polymerase [Magnetospirillum sp. UT-4]CAA7621149.1 hypothetical protein MTBUT4_380024 [Magnetospirillum sp. UT-4]
MTPADWQELYDLGFSIFPLQPKGKRPALKWEEYQARRPTEQEVARWASGAGRPNAFNVAVATGQISGVIVLDTDTEEAEEEVAKRGTPATPTVRTAKGRHRYYRHPGFEVRNFARRIPGTDLRGDGGYVVAAGSIHETGVVYEWEVHPRDVPFADPPDWLLELLKPAPVSEPPPPPARPTNENAYAEAAFDKELSSLRRAQQGGRNDQLNRSAFNLGQLVGAGALERGIVERHLLSAAMAIGLTEDESLATIKSGIEDGMADPRRIPERTARRQRVGGVMAPYPDEPPPDYEEPPRGGGGYSQTYSPPAPVADIEEERRRRRPPGPEPVRLTALDPIAWAGKLPPDRQWIAHDWIPCHTTTALYGDGGVGKTLLAQQLLTAVASNRAWCGLQVKQVKAIGFFCEDSADELHRRQDAICRGLDLGLGDLEDLRFFSRVADDNLLMTFDADGTGRRTPLWEAFRRAVLDFGAQLVVVDTAADVFGGNENIRNQVRQFIAMLTSLAMEIDGSVILCAHPSVSGIASGHGFAGSTAWNNSVRSRLYLTRPGDEGDQEDADTNERILTRMKANYAASGEAIRLKWDDGALMPIERETGFFGAMERGRAETAFIEALRKLEKQGREASPSVNAGSYAPKLIKAMPEGKGHRLEDLRRAMETLFADGRITVVEVGRHKSKRIVVCDKK